MRELDAVFESACLPWARQIELLQSIPRVGPRVAQVIIAESDGDMSKSPTASVRDVQTKLIRYPDYIDSFLSSVHA